MSSYSLRGLRTFRLWPSGGKEVERMHNFKIAQRHTGKTRWVLLNILIFHVEWKAFTEAMRLLLT
jgi:hypothetical protein